MHAANSPSTAPTACVGKLPGLLRRARIFGPEGLSTLNSDVIPKTLVCTENPIRIDWSRESPNVSAQ
jgi:hypothetical protein